MYLDLGCKTGTTSWTSQAVCISVIVKFIGTIDYAMNTRDRRETNTYIFHFVFMTKVLDVDLWIGIKSYNDSHF